VPRASFPYHIIVPRFLAFFKLGPGDADGGCSEAHETAPTMQFQAPTRPRASRLIAIKGTTRRLFLRSAAFVGHC
jgi:hypothetical protein